MIRLIIICICIIPFVIVAFPLLGIEWLIGKINKRAQDISSLRFVRFICRLILWLSGTKMTVIGKENIPDEAALFVANHRSIFDIFVMYANAKDLTGFVAKNSLEKIPFIRTWMKRMYCLFLDRDDVRQGLQIILEAIQYAKDGISIAIFPEGTRNKEDALTLLPFKEGSFKIALKSGRPIVPVAIYYDAPVFEDHIPWIKKNKVIVEYLAPIYTDRLDKEEKKGIGAKCQELVQETLRKNANSL